MRKLDHTRWKKPKHAVVYTPWQGEPCVVSVHASAEAADRKAHACRVCFRTHNPNAYGCAWHAMQVRPGENLLAALAKAEGRAT